MTTLPQTTLSDTDPPAGGFKETEIGPIPKDWGIATIGSLFDIQQGKAISARKQTGKSPRPFLRTANVFWGRLDLGKVDAMDFTDLEAEKLALQVRDLLVCEGGDIGRTAIWRGEIEGCSHQNHVHRLRAKSAEIEPLFYMYWMQAAMLLFRLYGGEGNKTTIPNLSKARLSTFQVPFPPLPEQRAIAQVLSKIQAAAEAQAAIAERVRELKRALMAKLFTEGLRGEPLKETEIGMIPVGWRSARLGELATIGNGSTPKRTEDRYWVGGSIPWLTSGKVHEGTIVEASELVTPIARQECHLPLVPKGSIVVAITGQGKTLGNSALLAIEACISQHLAYITFHSKEVVAEFALVYLRSRYEYLQMVGHAGGSTKGALTCGFLKTLEIPVPPIDDQRKLAHILQSVDARIDAAERKRAGLEELFRAMLGQLMTGRVRVKGLVP